MIDYCYCYVNGEWDLRAARECVCVEAAQAGVGAVPMSAHGTAGGFDVGDTHRAACYLQSARRGMQLG